MANQPDNIVRLLRDHLKDLEKQERELRREKDRTLKSLALWTPDESKIPTVGRRQRIAQGSIRRDSHTVLWNQLRTAFAPDFEFTYAQAEELGVKAGLRPGQANGAVTTLYRMGRLERTRKGHYKHHNGKEEKSDGT